MGKRAGVPTGAQIPFLREERHAAGAPEAQIPLRRARRSKILRDPLRLCSSERFKSQGAKRKFLCDCSLAQTNVSWGGKRARSALGGAGKHVLSGGSLHRPNNRCVHLVHFCAELAWGAKRARSAIGCVGADKPALSDHSLPLSNSSRVWEDLADGPAGRISELALTRDVADYIRFRAVCGPWRQCSPEPQALRGGCLDSRFFPRRWIMLDKSFSDHRRHRFLNVSTGECIRMDLPELDDHLLLWLTPEGLLLLLHEPTLVIRLLNPLTRQLTDLPSVSELLSPELKHIRLLEGLIGDALEVYGVGVTDDSTVAVCFGFRTMLAVAKPGDEHWTVVYKGYLDSTLPFAGRFYCCVRGSVMVLNTSGSDQPPRLLMAVERGDLFRFSQMTGSLHLVDNAGELMLVHRSRCSHRENGDVYSIKYWMKYEVYKVDLDARALIPANDFGGRAVFMGSYRTICVAAEAFPSVTADTLYLGVDCGEKRRMNLIDGYNIVNGSSEPSSHHDLEDDEEMAHTCSAINCLSYCIQGSGSELA